MLVVGFHGGWRCRKHRFHVSPLTPISIREDAADSGGWRMRAAGRGGGCVRGSAEGLVKGRQL